MLHSMIVTINKRMEPGDRGRRSDRAGRPLGPRSIVLSILLGSHPPEMPIGRLLEFTSLFGLADGAVRTAMSRMVAAGELENRDGRYRLAGRLLERQAQQDAGRTRPTESWDGTWWFAVVIADRRTVAERRDFRSQVEGARFGELRPDTWLRPANIDVPTGLSDVVLTRGPLLSGTADDLVSRLWDLPALERRATELASALGSSRRRLLDLDPTEGLPDAFTTMAACQRYLRTEPQLPGELGAGQASRDLRSDYDDMVRVFEEALAEFFGRERAGVSTAAR